MLSSWHKKLQYCLFSSQNLLKEGTEGGGGRDLLLGVRPVKEAKSCKEPRLTTDLGFFAVAHFFHRGRFLGPTARQRNPPG